MKKIYYISFAVISALSFSICNQAYSQNLNQKVEVSRTYVAKHADADKPYVNMAVPDSVLKFDLDFDYSVTDKPYKGSYEFKPYLLNLKPGASRSRPPVFFLRAGAGYTLHPALDFVVTPVIGNSFTMSVYGTHRSYFGNYREVSLKDNGASLVSDWNGNRYKGYDTYSSAGINSRTDWRTGFFAFDFGYLGYAKKDNVLQRGYDAFKANMRVASQNPADKYFFYDVCLSYLYGEDKLSWMGKSYLVEHDFSVNASLGPVFSKSQRALLDIDLDISDYGSMLSSYSGRFSITPRYVFRKARWMLDLGVELSVLMGADRAQKKTPLHSKRGQLVYPDVEIGFDAVKNYLNVYVKAEGGETINRYSDKLALNHHFTPYYAAAGRVLMDNSVERIKAVVGFRGNISSRLIYDLYGGYANYSNLMLDSVVYASGSDGVVDSSVPVAGYASCNAYFAELDLSWHSKDVKAESKFRYNGTDLLSREAAVLSPSPFTADVDVVYNWKKRIYAGIHCNAAIARKGFAAPVAGDAAGENVLGFKVPGYCDLGISAEYRFNRIISFWVYGGNLLNMSIQKTPFYSESGIYCTAGITLSL